MKLGLCPSHYSALRRRKITLGKWIPRGEVTGSARRLQALVAIGYTQAEIARQMGTHESWVSRLVGGYGRQVNAETVARIKEVYDRLAMTPGPSDRARRHAHKHNWAPPLAWDEDTIDDPAAKPDVGVHRPLGFAERYTEERELGYNDLQILARWRVRPESLVRQLHRYDMPVAPELMTLAASRKYRRRQEAS
jgi:transcriptional regulator with XRE-family HTH domain